MKTGIVIMFNRASLLFLVVFCSLQVTGNGNVFKNSSFEKEKKDKPVYWGMHDWRGRSKFSLDRTANKGKKSLLIELSNIKNSRATFGQTRKMNVPEGRQVTLSFFARTKDLSYGPKGQTYLQLRLTPVAKNQRKKGLTVYIKPSEKWTLFTRSVKVPYEMKQVYVLGLVDKVKGKIWIDDVHVTILDPKEKLVLFGFQKPAPLIDGILNDSTWKNTQTASGFCKLGCLEEATHDTQVKMCYDVDNIYISALAKEPLTGKLNGSKKEPWAGDCMEFFIAPNNAKHYYHIIVDCAGNVYTGFNDGTEHPVKLAVKAKSFIKKGQWSLEMAVPFAALKTAFPKDNTKWRFNVVRVRRTAYQKTEISSWALLSSFTERDKFGKLAFYKDPEIEGDMAFWENSNRSGLMDRAEVSGIVIAREMAGKKPFPNLWDYSPFIKREKPAAQWRQRGLTQTTKKQYPEFYQTAMKFNALMIEKSFADEKLNMAFRAGATKQEFKILQQESVKINQELNRLYQIFGRAFNHKRDVSMLKPLKSDIPNISQRIKALDQKSIAILKKVQNTAAARTGQWTTRSLKAVPNKKYPNKSGYSRRFKFMAHSFLYNEESLMQLGPFSAHSLHPNYVSPKQKDGDNWNYDFLNEGTNQRKNEGIMKHIYCSFGFGMHDLIVPMVSEIKKVPGVYMQSADKRKVHTKNVFLRQRAANIHNKALMDYSEKYLIRCVKEITDRIPRASIDLFLIAQEGKNNFRVYNDQGKTEYRSMGYTPEANADFCHYLKQRYDSISKLNACWRTSYKAFAEIKTPRDKFITPRLKVTGLRLEHERWTRVTYLQWISKIKNIFHKAAPGIPVMEDMSYFLLDGNMYLAFKENCADIISFHSSPKRELPMWRFMTSINSRFDKLLGYYENYWGMFRRAHMNNEKLAKRDVDKFFFELFMQHINVSGWWLRYVSSPGIYLASYNHGPYYLEYDQYIFRWSTTALPVMFQKGLNLEKMLLETTLKKSKNAVIQPCTSVYALGSQGYNVYDSPAVTLPFTLHNDFMRPLNINYEFVPEEMLLDGRAALNEFKTIILPYAPYLTRKFSRQIKQWVADGGTLLAIGPFALYDAAGFVMESKDSLLKTLFPEAKLGKELWDFSISDKITSPSIVSKKYKKGSVTIFDQPLRVYNLDSHLKTKTVQILKQNLQRIVKTNVKEFRLVVRVSKDGTHWLAVNNLDVLNNMHAEVMVHGKFHKAYDVTIPGWMPLSTKISGNQTKLKINLRPGDWTVIKLQK
jgi:Beta-galactosidase/Carbohydrate family 9 binding domain-like